MAERIRAAIATGMAGRKAPDLPRVTASGGIATIASSAASPGLLVTAADGALYQAKEAGGNRIVEATIDPEPDKRAG